MTLGDRVQTKSQLLWVSEHCRLQFHWWYSIYHCVPLDILTGVLPTLCQAHNSQCENDY